MNLWDNTKYMYWSLSLLPAHSSYNSWSEKNTLCSSIWSLTLSLTQGSKTLPKGKVISSVVIALGGFPGGSEIKNPSANARDASLIPGLWRSPGKGNGNPLKYFSRGNPMDRGARTATVRGVTKSQTWQWLNNTGSILGSLGEASGWVPRWLLDGSSSPERPSQDSKLEIFSPTPYSSEGEEGVKMKLVIDHAHMRKLP